MYPIFICFFLISLHFVSPSNAQQNYSGKSVFTCNNTDETGPSSSFLYACNGLKKSCQSYLIFRSQANYNSARTISNFTSSSLPELARINNISDVDQVLPEGSDVIMPVNCSCSSGNKYYQANTSYTIKTEFETYYTIAYNTSEGLSTCDAMMQQNPYNAYLLKAGYNLRMPLRCACPTKKQAADGVKYLLTHSITGEDNVDDLSERFNVSTRSVLDANGFTEDDPTVYDSTTILIPLRERPSRSRPGVYSIPPPVAPPPPVQSITPIWRKSKNLRNGIYLGIAIGGSLGLLFCSSFLLFWYFKGERLLRLSRVLQGNKQRREMKHVTENIKRKINDFDSELKIYGYEEVEAGTRGFSPYQKLSDSVYRGVLRGKPVAIKKTSRDVKKEVDILQKINHFNLISLYGVCMCNYSCSYYLAYEFMENGSLKQWLNQVDNSENQSWNIRIRMALDIANGLDYLHNFTAPGYVHKDINSSNILVNSDLRAKIANFNFAKPGNSISRSSSCSSSSSFVVESKGYYAPEFSGTGRVSPAVDVYAFGVVLLELITGKDAIFAQNGRNVLLSELAFSVVSAANVMLSVREFMDSNLQERHPLGFIIDHAQLALRLIELSLACIAIDSTKRPTMAAVISSLLKIQLDVKQEHSFSMD